MEKVRYDIIDQVLVNRHMQGGEYFQESLISEVLKESIQAVNDRQRA